MNVVSRQWELIKIKVDEVEFEREFINAYLHDA
jgi:hypothetical protein